MLKGWHVYLPGTAETVRNAAYDSSRTDLIVYYEPIRQFAISELRAGRLPWWSPCEFGGVPCFRWNLLPPWLLAYLIASPVVLAWVQLLVALVAAGGAYFFFSPRFASRVLASDDRRVVLPADRGLHPLAGLLAAHGDVLAAVDAHGSGGDRAAACGLGRSHARVAQWHRAA